jgi:TolA-binding protein
MQATYNIRKEAFLNAVNQFDVSTLPLELQQEINILCNALKEQATEDRIKQLNSLVEKCEPLKQLYDTQRRNLKKQESEQERSKGFSVTNDNPKPEQLGSTNTNPPTPPSDNSNSQSSPSTQSTNKTSK